MLFDGLHGDEVSYVQSTLILYSLFFKLGFFKLILNY